MRESVCRSHIRTRYMYLNPIYIPDILKIRDTKGLREKGHGINVMIGYICLF